MAKNLIIVESPAKIKTIKKFLGPSYHLTASMGHVRDLPKSTMGVDIEGGFEPRYITIRGKGELISDLKKEAQKATKIYLATDPDREGEAISWHLKELLGPENEAKISRITFNEITKDAVTKALKNPRSIDMNLVDAQQARRVMDRIVGYSISPILWEKIKRGLSAGRVQSVALRLVSERDAEIAAFRPEEYHTVEAVIRKGRKEVKALYYGENGRKKELKTAEEAAAIVADVKGQDIRVTEKTVSERSKNAPWPFTTSTLQQEASRLLNLSTQQTMRIAQKLYEEGHITYLRTDSVRVSDEAVAAAVGYIKAAYGEKYVSRRTGAAGSKGGNVQDAHEAIRPSHIENTPDVLKEKLSRDELRLYQLIWKRFAASRMTPARYEQTKVRLDHAAHTFFASGSKRIFDGYLAVYKNDDDEEDNVDLRFLRENETVKFETVEDVRHFTEPPKHFTEATLVRTLEEDGIGRPSTYAPTITTLLSRNYITKEKKFLYVTELGSAVNELMTKAFPNEVDTGFTADMEEKLDRVAAGEENWKKVIGDYYPSLKESLDAAHRNLERIKVADRETDEVCEKCGRNMVIKYGPHGRFLACPGFPACRNTKPLLEKIGAKCPKCGRDIVKKRSRNGRLFYSCIGYPDCDYASYKRPSAAKKEI